MYKFFLCFLLLCGGLDAKTHILVSILPQKFLVEQIGGSEVTVTAIIPAGANAHTYEPTPKQVIALKQGDIWFRIGENFEPRLLSILTNTLIVDQREGLDLISAGCGCCLLDSYDPHIWLSPKLLKKQTTQIAEVLMQKDPLHKELFATNLLNVHSQLDQLDLLCSDLLAASVNKTVLVSHPAFGYLCRDYGLQQMSIEMEGKEPSPRYLTHLIDTARTKEVKIVILQKQHNPKGGLRIAQELGISAEFIDPYEENVIDNIHRIARLFSKA